MATGDVSLNPSIRSADTIEFQNSLRAKIVGQDRRCMYYPLLGYEPEDRPHAPHYLCSHRQALLSY